MENNTEDFDDIIQEAGLDLDKMDFAYFVSFQTKKAGKPGKLPTPVNEFKEFIELLAKENGFIMPEKKSELFKVLHINNRLYMIIDPTDTFMGAMFGEQLKTVFETYRKYSIDLQIRISTAMTIKSIVETVNYFNRGQ